MNTQFCMEKLSLSGEFKEFMKKNPSAYLCSGFFVIDKNPKNPKNPDDKQHFDYYIPSSKKMFSFQLEDGIKLVPVEMLNRKVPKKILKYEFDFNEMENIIIDEMEKQNIKNKIQKIIFSLQKSNGKESLIATVFISMLGMLKVKIDINERKITEFEKKSLFDILKVTKKKE